MAQLDRYNESDLSKKNKVKIFKCKFCDRRFDEYEQYAKHIETIHPDVIPEDMSAYQYVYYLKTNKTHGNCVVCKAETSWNVDTQKYKRFCENPACKKEYVKIFKERMIGKYGKVSLLKDPDHQRKMLANRKISGEYRWSDYGAKVPYTGKYERAFLEFLDEVMDYKSDDIMSPSPHTYYYMYEGDTKFYIPDLFIPSLNLEIEIKDGGDNPNNHPKIQAVDKVKEKLKDEVLSSNTSGINFIKITNMEHRKFLEYLELAKYNYMNGIAKPIFML